MATRKDPAKNGTEERELIDTGTSKRSVRRGANGRFTTDQVLISKPRKSANSAPRRSRKSP